MDPRLYTYEYRRPRLSNPTYNSHNVNNSLAYYLNGPVQSRTPGLSEHSSTGPEQRQSHQQLSKNRSSYLENIGKSQRYEEAKLQPMYERQSSLPKMDNQQPSRPSQLSSYGSNIVSQPFKPSIYNDQEVYKKQEKKFNIITLHPNPYNQTIKQYPKLTLEDQDVYYYKKLRQQQMYHNQQEALKEMETYNKQVEGHQHTEPTQKNERSAGKPSFNPYQGPFEQRTHPNGKALTNLDELSHI